MKVFIHTGSIPIQRASFNSRNCEFNQSAITCLIAAPATRQISGQQVAGIRPFELLYFFFVAFEFVLFASLSKICF